MIRPIVKDVLFLGQKSELATKEDIEIIDDLVRYPKSKFRELCWYGC